ncbi:hypothetical protein Aglo01_22530 [Actinokineospora globicatena]|nr:hypothetical protein Aglo01_22530 [Actinokineospora globicatena]
MVTPSAEDTTVNTRNTTNRGRCGALNRHTRRTVPRRTPFGASAARIAPAITLRGLSTRPLSSAHDRARPGTGCNTGPPHDVPPAVPGQPAVFGSPGQVPPTQVRSSGAR